MPEIFKYGFMVRAFLAGITIAVIAPMIRNFLVIRRFSLIADTLSHVALAGVAIGMLIGTPPLFTTVLVTVTAAVVIEKLRANNNLPGDAVLAMFLPGGLAVSIILISLANGVNSNLFSYLFGSITTVKKDELILILILGIVTAGIVTILYKKLLYSSFDEDAAYVSGVPVQEVNTILVVLTAITVSISMRVVGILLIGALMVIPVLTSMQLGKSFMLSVYYSVFFALISVISGLLAAYYLNLPAGGAIVIISLSIFALITFLKKGIIRQG